MTAFDRLREVADRCVRADDWKAARAALVSYLDTWDQDRPDLISGSQSVAVDAQIARLDASPGCRRLVRSMRTDLVEARRGALRVAAPGETSGPVRLVDAVGEDALGRVADLVVPPGYAINAAGVWSTADEEARPVVAPRPVYVAALVRDVVSGDYHADLVWRSPGRDGWVRKTYSRGVLSDARQLTRTARDGVPVDSGTAAGLVRFLTAFESANAGRLEVTHCAPCMGWQGVGADLGFLWGRHCIGGDVRLQAEGGKAQHAAGFVSGGTFDQWRSQVWEPIQLHPRVVLGVYAALAPVVLGVVTSAPGFVVDWSGRSTGGKTTTLRAAASVWGDPGRLVKSWSATTAAIEHLASFSAHLPTILDDTKEAKKQPDKVIGAVYQVTGTASKLRAHPDGLREVANFRTVLLSSGEVPITSFGQDTGAAARVLPIRGFPFDEDADNARETADGLNASTLEVYGHAGPAVVSWLDANRDKWDGLRAYWEEAREEVVRSASGPFVGRAAPYVATLRTAAAVLERACGLEKNARALDLAKRCAVEGATVAQRHRAALRDLWDWLSSRPDLHDAHEDQRQGREVVVRWDQGPPAVIARSLRQWLEREGYQLDVLEEWARLGLIKVTTDGRQTHPVDFRSVGRRVRCYVFTAAATALALP